MKRIPTRLITDEFAFSLATEGWHYFRSLVAEYERDNDIPPQNTTFFRFFEDERVRAVRYLNDLLFLHDPAKRENGFRFYFGTYPWGDWWTNDSIVGGNPWGHHYDRMEGKMTRDLYGYRRNPWYQPGDRYALDCEWNQTIRLYHSIQGGYYPFRYRSLPGVVLLVRRDGEIRAIRCKGHHRLSILSHLGHKNVTVVIPSDSIGMVRESEVGNWYYVKHKLCTAEQALKIFHAYFDLNGRERIEYLNLPPVY